MPKRNPTPDTVLGEVIRDLRERRDESLEVVAVSAGITANTLGQIERGVSDTSWQTVRSIARALDTSVGELARAVEAEER